MRLSDCSRALRAAPILVLVSCMAFGTEVPVAMRDERAIDPWWQEPLPVHVHDAAGRSGNGVIRGRVIDGTRGVPIARASITVLGSDARAPSAGMWRAARTQADGTYVVTNLPAGTYRVTAHKDGYHSPLFRDLRRAGPDGPTPTSHQALTLTEDATLTMSDVMLLRGGALTGRVVDEEGDPVIRAQVRPIGSGGAASMPPRRVRPGAVTDDRGRYRLYGLAPGRYTVHVVPRPWRPQGGGATQGDRREPLPAFASSATEFSGAAFVDVTSGTEATLDATLPSGQRAMVTGRVQPDDGQPLAASSVTLRSADPEVLLNYGGAGTGGDGRFAIPDVAPGRYVLVAEEMVPVRGAHGSLQPGSRVGWTDVEVTGGDLEDVVVSIGPGATIRGRVELDGAGPGAFSGRLLRVAARRPRHAVPGRHLEAEVGQDLTFTLAGVQGPEALQVTGLPEGWWVKAITVGGRDALAGHEFPRRGILDDVVVVVSAHPTGVTGRVQGVSAAFDAVVVALPEDDAGTGDPTRAQLQPVQADGSFAMRGLRPGRYALAALTSAAMEAHSGRTLPQQAEFVRSVGVIIDVREANVQSTVLRLTDAEP